MSVPVSVVITSFNNAGHVESAVRSVLQQTAPVSEIIIADDCSTDGSPDLLRTLEDAHPTIRAIVREQNVGIAANRDLALRQAASPFVTHLDADDTYAPGKIENEFQMVRGGLNVVSFSQICLHRQSKSGWKKKYINPHRCISQNKKQFICNILSRKYPIPRDMLLSKALYLRAGGYIHKIKMYEDWDLKMRLANQTTDWRFCQGVGTHYIKHGGGLSDSSKTQHLRWLFYVVNQNCDLIHNCVGEKPFVRALIDLAYAYGEKDIAAYIEAGMTKRVPKPSIHMLCRELLELYDHGGRSSVKLTPSAMLQVRWKVREIKKKLRIV